MRKFTVLLMATTLAGCGVAAKIDARRGYEESAAKYKQCLQQTGSPQKCEAHRLAMEVDERKFGAMSAGVTEGGASTANINVQHR